MKQKTRAFHRLTDDVAAEVKQRRHMELVAAFRTEAVRIHASQIGSKHLVLVEGVGGTLDHRSQVSFIVVLCGVDDGTLCVVCMRVCVHVCV